MSPKPKYTHDEIADAAFALAREKGIGAVVAREVGHMLGTTPSPIFTVFKGMDALRQEVHRRAKQYCVNYLSECFDYIPMFKEFGLRWISFAENEPELYRLLFLTGGTFSAFSEGFDESFSSVVQPLLQELCRSFFLEEKEARELLRQMLIHANGICALRLNGIRDLSEEQVGRSLSEICISRVLLFQLRRSALNMDLAMQMAESTEKMPQKKEKYMESRKQE